MQLVVALYNRHYVIRLFLHTCTLFKVGIHRIDFSINPNIKLQPQEFPSLYRLQRHYDNRPGHIPGDSHKSLFHCLLAMTHQHTRQDKASMFLKQLEEFVAKLRELLPCLLTKMEGGDGTTCDIGDFVGR